MFFAKCSLSTTEDVGELMTIPALRRTGLPRHGAIAEAEKWLACEGVSEVRQSNKVSHEGVRLFLAQ